MIGQNALQLNIDIDPELRAAIGQELREKGRFRNKELSIRTPAGEIRHLLDSGAMVLIGGKPHNLGLFQDITERKQAEQKIQNQLQHLNALREIDTVISSSFNINVSLEAIVSRAVEELGVDAADVLIYDSISHTLAYQTGQGFRTKAVQYAKLRVGEGIVGRCVHERKPIHIRDLRQYEHEFVRKALLAEEKFISYHCIPLINKGEVKGVLEIFHRSELEVGQDWIDFLRTLAGQAAIAIESATLFDSLQRSNLELGLAYDQTIEGWSRALDLRDKETGGHTQRVAELAVKLARAFGFSSAELLQIRRGALLHDIGKLGVPDEILFKLGLLSDDDWAKMRKHPQFAFELIAPIQYLRPALDIPYCHHEKWDGSGYPRGLQGEQIPLAARLFAVVDVWDALRQNRPYRAGWPEEKVFEYIRSQTGTHFDPQCVELFFQMMSEKAPGPKPEAE
jgi:HD-GYP domain-containing protein (c-di-GMP phosphodiesterase class II)